MEDKYLYCFRFFSQERATNYLNKVAKQFADDIEYIDMKEKYVEFDNALYYFWDMLRDDGIQFDKEYDEKDFHKIVSDLMCKYSS